MTTAHASAQIKDGNNERYVMVLSRTANKIIVRDYNTEKVFHLMEDGRFVCHEYPHLELL